MATVLAEIMEMSHWEHLKAGVKLHQEGDDLEAALEELAKGYELAKQTNRPEFIKPFHSIRGVYYQQAGRYDEAIREFEAMAEIDPTSPAGTSCLGGVYAKLGDFAQAEKCLRKAISLGDGGSYLTFIGLCKRKGDREQANALARECAEKFPAWPYGRLLLWNALLEEKDPSLDVEEVIQHCLPRVEESYDFSFTLGLAYAAQGNKERAVSYLRSYCEQASHDDEDDLPFARALLEKFQ